MAGPIVHVLDVGQKKYGDSILVQLSNGKTILVDGGNPESINSVSVHSSIPAQLELLVGPPPFHVSLLVITHAHNDHIGCLPKMVADGLLMADMVLAADPDLGWGQPMDGSELDADEPVEIRGLYALLREDIDLSHLSDAEIADAAIDAGYLRTNYTNMLTRLAEQGSQVVRYLGRGEATPLLAAVSTGGVQIRILGPGEEQLLECADRIEQIGRDVLARLDRTFDAADRPSLGAIYRRLLSTAGVDALDASPGAAINNQSILLLIEDSGKKILLTGDMQFAAPGVSSLSQLMPALRTSVSAAGPFELVKVGHHGSHNAFNSSILQEMGETYNFVISTGRNSSSHPSRPVLDLLQQNTDTLLWLRTDHNGRVGFDFRGTTPTYWLERGTVNDSIPNPSDAPRPVVSSTATQPAASVSQGLAAKTAEAASTPPVSQEPVSGIVEVTARVPHVTTRVTITIDVEPRPHGAAIIAIGEGGSTGVPTPAEDAWRLAAGRTLPYLAFVTCRPALDGRIGAGHALPILDALRRAGMLVIDDVPPQASAADAASHVRGRIGSATSKPVGVVLLGGYEVVPADRLDVLPRTLRQSLGSTGDPDDFLVFSDDLYGCTDGDGDPELPVSRIPDGGSAAVLRSALGSDLAASGAMGVRNVRRPFADGVFELLDNGGQMHRSRDMVHTALPDIRNDRVYLMLHGDWEDGTQFWGEDVPGNLAAVHLNNIAEARGGIVFTGCCWGALTVERPAVMGTQVPVSKAVERSLAMRFLARGANAFVGCTGAHYSPTVPPYGYFGEPLHRAFWQRVLSTEPPARALYNAKLDYIRGMFHGRSSESDQAIEYKILRQYTCLGLGW